MQSPSRYEIVDEIASGDFATVYRGRDLELGREVAIKQIHRQFLGDARQLDRYWQEAQLLASLQHRNVLTIYDIVRPRGWLILELMQASLHDLAHGEPLDLDILRLALACGLQALKFLHENHVIHGDVKPSNLLVDKRNWIKLGDFGLARRASSDRGSLLKGTTRYMAPELVSDRFGPVGPASDLYSLGFSAYELMCGEQFDSLFPGLEAFGRDKQIAWMMWHSATDRRLPPIARVLEGVPEDLARVIEKLVAKNPSERYRTAAEALADLKPDPALFDAAPAEELDEAELARRRRRRRLIGIGSTFAGSLVVILTIALLMGSPPPPPTLPPEPPPVEGTVRNLLVDKHKLVMEVDGPQRVPREIEVREIDRVFLNGTASLLRDLQEGDRLSIKTMRDAAGRKTFEIFASRPQLHHGVIESVAPDEGRLTLKLAGDAAKQLVLRVPQTLAISLNNRKDLDSRPVTLADLQPGDHADVRHDGTESEQTASELSVVRGVTLAGILRAIDPAKGQLTVARGDESDAKLEVWPIAEKCEVLINDRRSLQGRLLATTDLLPGDEVTIVHDTSVLRVSAFRTFHTAGTVEDVRAADHVLTVLSADDNKIVSLVVPETCAIKLNGESVELADLHRGDTVAATHDAPDAKGAEVKELEAERGVDPRRYALVIGVQAYEDKALVPLKFAAADAELVAHTLTSRFQVASDHLLLLVNDSRIRLEQSVPAFLEKVPGDAQLIVYFVGHAYVDGEGKVYLAPTDFALARTEASGLPLSWLAGEVEKCPARDKLLLFDTGYAAGAGAKRQPAAAEMLTTLKLPSAASPFRTLTGVASSRAGQRAGDDTEHSHGRFAWNIAQGLTGKADKNRDNRLEPTELYEYLAAAMAVGGKNPQSPELFLPDAAPPRLSEEAKVAIRKLAAQLQARVNLKSAKETYEAAQAVAGKQPEPDLLYGLILTKAKKEADALKVIDELRSLQPELLPALEIGTWLHFRKQNYAIGVDDLMQLVARTQKQASRTPAAAEQAGRLMQWIGRLREFAAVAVPEQNRPPQAALEVIDEAVGGLPKNLQQSYGQGRQHVQFVARAFDKKIADEADSTSVLKLQVDRRQLSNYVGYPLEAAVKSVIEGLNQ